jgi:MFS family permease
MNSRRAWIVLSVGVVAYIVSVMQRTSLSVAAIDATERFGVSAAALSSLAFAQLVVFAGMQIPAGVLLDRFGPRTMLAVGAAVMALGQVTLALAPTIEVAVVGRILLGAADATSFISVLRLTVMWFSPSRVPIMTQAIGVVGGAGQLLSTFPLLALLHLRGWTAAYLSAASLSVLVAVVVVAIVRRGPNDPQPVPAAPGEALEKLKDALSRPGTRLGFWSQYVAGGSANMFGMLWGFPFLSVGLGYGPSIAASMLVLTIATTVIIGPVFGAITARHPLRRSAVVLSVVTAMGVVWALVLAWPGAPPFGLVVLLVIVTSVGGSASVIGLDFARTFNDSRSQGSAAAFAIVGAFTASLTMMLAIGLILEVLDRAQGGSGNPAELYSLDSFRIAFLIQYPIVAVGIVFFLRARRQTRKRLHEEEGIVVGPLWVAVRDNWRNRRR